MIVKAYGNKRNQSISYQLHMYMYLVHCMACEIIVILYDFNGVDDAILGQ